MTDPSESDPRITRAEATGYAVALVLTTSIDRLDGDAGVMIVVQNGVACTAVHVRPESQAAHGLGYWASTLASELRELATSLERDLLEQHGPPRN